MQSRAFTKKQVDKLDAVLQRKNKFLDSMKKHVNQHIIVSWSLAPWRAREQWVFI